MKMESREGVKNNRKAGGWVETAKGLRGSGE